jgi:hypothetical protein
MKEDSDTYLANILDIPAPIKEELQQVVSETIVDADIVISPVKSIKREKKDLVRQDFLEARKNMKELISTGFNAIDGMMKVATASDSPRAYEVVSILLKTITEMNTGLVELHEKANKAEPEITKQIKNTTNNSIFVGSTKDLQNIINQSRSQIKHINHEELLNDET